MGQEAKQRQSVAAFGALYDENQNENEDRHDDEDKKQEDEEEGAQRTEGDEQQDDENMHLRGDQDRRDEPDSEDENPDETPRDRAVTNHEDLGEVKFTSFVFARGLFGFSRASTELLCACFHLSFARTTGPYARRWPTSSIRLRGGSNELTAGRRR